MDRLVLLLASLPSVALSQTLTFEADNGAHFIRCTDMVGNASCEVILSAASDYYECVALDEAGKPIASASAMPGLPVVFRDLNAAGVASVACRAL